MAIAQAAARQLGMSDQEISSIMRRMMQGRYHDLLDVIDEVFPYCFQFKNDPRSIAAGADC
jgi:hypothetical protein